MGPHRPETRETAAIRRSWLHGIAIIALVMAGCQGYITTGATPDGVDGVDGGVSAADGGKQDDPAGSDAGSGGGAIDAGPPDAVQVGCGNGVVEDGEQCDGTLCCDSQCAVIPDGQACLLGTCQDQICRQDVTNSNAGTTGSACLGELFDSVSGEPAELNIPIDFNGRISVGDLDNDGVPDFVMSNRNRLAAYTLCGQKLWDIEAGTNWDFDGHYFWNLTTYGYIGDADGDGDGEFLHISNDWHTLLVRNGLTGAVEHSIGLPGGIEWMYVFLARRSDDEAGEATRVVVSGSGYASNFSFATYDLRSGSPVAGWTYNQSMGSAKSVYLAPQAANLDGQGGDEIFMGTLALNENGGEIWRFNVGGMSILSAIHAATVMDIDPTRAGLESVHSVYAPNNGQPSLVAYGAANSSEVWRAYSPHSELHPHQHTVGDFEPDRAGLEVLTRNNDAKNHWMTDGQGNVIRQSWRVHPGWDNSGEYVQGIEWDAVPGTEVTYLERHVKNDGTHAIRSRMVIMSPLTDTALTPQLAGGTMEDTRGWTGVTSQDYFNPYESAALMVDIMGDGREEIFTWGNGKVTIYYNTGDENVPKRWGDLAYQARKKLVSYLYSPR